MKDKFFIGILYFCMALALIPLFSVLGYILVQGVSALNLDFFTQLPAPVGEVGGGMANAMLGTLIMVSLGACFSLPIGILAGFWLAESGHGKMGFYIRYCADVMSGIPTIILGMFAYIVFVLPTQRFSALAGSVALAIIMIPSITRTTEEMVKMVPRTLKESALALGIPQWRVSWSVVLRSARNGILSGAILALARSAGETAPLLFTAFSNLYWNVSLQNPMASMTVQIYTYAISPYDEWHRMAWAGALTLVSFVLVTTILVRIFSKRVTYA